MASPQGKVTHSEFNAYKVETTSQQRKLINSEKALKTTYLTLHDDDGRAEFMSKIKPVLDEYGFKMSVCINPNLIGTTGHMTWANIETLVSEGHEVLNHGYGHTDPSTITLEQLQANYELEKDLFIEHGLDTYDYYVYPGVQDWTNAETKNKVSSVYKCCFANTDAPTNYIPFDNFAVRRTAIALDTSITVINDYIDKKGYCILFGHAYMADYDLTKLRTTLDYIQANIDQITFVSAKTMIDNYTNIINLGNLGIEYEKFLLDKNGNVDFSIGNKSINELACITYGYFDGKPITDYKKNSISLEVVGGSYATWWLPEAGIVKTYRFTDDRFAYQEYTKIGSAEIWKRVWDDIKKRWTHFSPLSGVSVSTANRPKYIKRGMSIFDYTLLKPLWAQADGFTLPNTVIQRSTAYDLGVYGNSSGSYLYECIQAGITSDVAPTFTYVIDDEVIDGTVIWKYIGIKVTWRDGVGASTT